MPDGVGPDVRKHAQAAGACSGNVTVLMATFVLLNLWLNVVADIATRITGEEISVSNKYLDQNERLDDFGTRTRPHFFSDRNLNIH